MLYTEFVKAFFVTMKERGAGMAEYALLLALVAVALIAAFQGLATGISTLLSSVVSGLN